MSSSPNLFSPPTVDLPNRKRRLDRRTFAERACAYYQRPLSQFPKLAWRIGAAWPVRVLRRAIVLFAPRYFEAEDFYLDRAADCRCRTELAEEMDLLRGSYLRRGIWRYFGCGINGRRILRYYDQLVAETCVETAVARTETIRVPPHSISALDVNSSDRR